MCKSIYSCVLFKSFACELHSLRLWCINSIVIKKLCVCRYKLYCIIFALYCNILSIFNLVHKTYIQVCASDTCLFS